jgi:hypothetical protein
MDLLFDKDTNVKKYFLSESEMTCTECRNRYRGKSGTKNRRSLFLRFQMERIGKDWMAYEKLIYISDIIFQTSTEASRI